jgi:hypothetical protein
LSEPVDLRDLRISCPDGSTHGPYALQTPSPGDVVRIPPEP